MDRNNGRYTFVRRQGGQQHHHQHHNQSSSSLSSSSASSSPSTNTNNNHNLDNHRNSSASSSSSQFSTASSNTTSAYSSQSSNMSRESLTQHDELIRYIREAWTKVNEQGPPVYRNESDSHLKNFKPFNLEEYWGQRLVQNIHVSHGHQ